MSTNLLQNNQSDQCNQSVIIPTNLIVMVHRVNPQIDWI